MAETGKPWPECLSLVKLYMRITPSSTGLTQFKVVDGHPFTLPLWEGEPWQEKNEEEPLSSWMYKMFAEKNVQSACKLPLSLLSRPQETAKAR